MAKYAIVKDGVVISTIVWDGVGSLGHLDGEAVLIPDDIKDDPTKFDIGATYNGSTFSWTQPPPAESTPEEVARKEKIDSAIAKLEGLGLTVEEIKEAFDIE